MGSDYIYVPEAAEAVQRARANVIGWDDLGLRKAAMTLVNRLPDKVAAGQRQLFLRPADDETLLGKDAVDAVMALLCREEPRSADVAGEARVRGRGRAPYPCWIRRW